MKRKFPLITLSSILISVLGVLIVHGFSLDLGSEETKGNLLAVSCSVCMALVFLISEKIIIEEFEKSKNTLEKLLKTEVNSICFPEGKFKVSWETYGRIP